MSSRRPTVCAYYFPNWHIDPRNEAIHGKNWTEWRVTQYATPRFPGHDQPKIPLWGYGDEADPAVMEQKIRAAAEHGVDAFIFDWYWFSDGSYRERCIRDGFFGAPNAGKLKFAIMWANHDPVYAHPGSYWKPAEPLWSGSVDCETFRKCTDHLINNYFNRPNYLRIDGKLYFSVFRMKAMVEQMGGRQAAREAFDDFRRRVEKANLGEVMLDCIVNNLTGDGSGSANALVRELGIDCCSNYNWGGTKPEDFPALPYEIQLERTKDDQFRFARELTVPYNPVACPGWDCSPRTVQSDMFDKCAYPFGVVITGNTPALFQRVLEQLREGFDTGKITGPLLHLACWNEWTEGAYLEPDTVHGYGMLEAIKNTFGVNPDA